MEFGTQIVSLGVIIVIIINYYRSKKMPLISTRVFTAFLWVSFFNIVFEFCTLTTIGRLDEIPELNRLAHQFFIGSIDILVFLLFIYVDLKSRTQKRYSAGQLLLRTLPLILSLTVVAIGKLYYSTDPNAPYSYGPMAITVYASVALYVSVIAILLIREKNGFTLSAKLSIAFGLTLWAGIAVYQYFNPDKLLSSMGVSLMVLFIYISFEHPTEYLDHELRRCLNRFAFALILDETFAKKRPFYVVSVHILKQHRLISSFGHKQYQQLIGRMALQLCDCRTCYHSRGSVLSMVLDANEYAGFLYRSKDKLRYHDEELSIDPQYFISVIPCPRYAVGTEELLSLMNFISELGEAEEYSGLVRADEETIKKLQGMNTLEQLLQNAILNDGFDVFYQPIYSTEKKAFISSEALIRLKDTQTLGFVSPELFIPLAEQKGLIKDIGNIVFEKVCAFAAENRLFENGLEYIEINLSGVQGEDSTIVDSLSAIMKKHGIDPRCINLEITETAAIENGRLLLENMNRLRALGCQFSMDDFGTGYSNLAQMADTEFDLIKLDKSLLWSYFSDNSEKALCILNACIELIQSLKIRIVQEGVETKEQADFLTDKKVSYLQGYYFSRPICGADYLEFLKTH